MMLTQAWESMMQKRDTLPGRGCDRGFSMLQGDQGLHGPPGVDGAKGDKGERGMRGKRVSRPSRSKILGFTHMDYSRQHPGS